MCQKGWTLQSNFKVTVGKKVDLILFLGQKFILYAVFSILSQLNSDKSIE